MSVTIPTPPTPPSTSSPGDFNTKADAYLAWWASLASAMDGEGPMLGVEDILGTVSESGGDPTGAIIEAGSNANGDYTKFADGTLICRKRNLSTASGAAAVWTYPEEFSATPAVNATSGYTGGPRIIATDPGTTSCDVYSWAPDGDDTVTPGVTVIAIGRWF